MPGLEPLPEALTVEPLPPASPPHPVSRAPGHLWLAGGTVFLLVVAPLLFLLGTVAGAGIETWEIIASRRTAELLGNTGRLVAAVTAASIAIGVGTAWLTVRTDLPGRRAWGTVLSLPLVIPSYVGALAIVSAFGPTGLLAQFFDRVPTVSGFWGAFLALTLFTYPYVHLLVVAALRNLDPALEEVARGLGSSPPRVFRRVVLPQLRPAVAAGGLLVALYTLSDFGAVSIMRYDVFTRAIYLQFVGRSDRTPALVLSVALIAVALALLAAERMTRGPAAYFRPRPARAPRRVALGRRGRTLALGLLTLLMGIALVVPLAVLGWWLLRGLLQQQSIGSVWPEALRSLTAAGLAGLAAVVAALPVAVLTIRHPSRPAAALERTVWTVYGLPHITVGLALVFLGARLGPPIYQSLPLLVVAYVILFLPQAAGAAQASLRQIDPHLEEASRSLGRSWSTTMGRVVVPLMSPGLLTGGALVFLTAMKELPATLLLRPTGFETLAVRIFAAAEESFYTRASAAALLLVAVSALPIYLFTIRDVRT